VRENVSIRLACAGAEGKKGSKAVCQKEKAQEVKNCIFHVCLERPVRVDTIQIWHMCSSH